MVSEEDVAAYEKNQERCVRRAIRINRSRTTRLSQDLIRISKQIGILPEEIPHLVTSISDLEKMILNSRICKSVNQLERILSNKSDQTCIRHLWGLSIA